MKKPPKTLQTKGRAFWRRVLKDFLLEESHELQLLQEAAGCLDRIAEAQAEIEAKKPYFNDRFGQPRPHPALNVEKDQRVLFVRIVRELGLQVESEEYSRPKRPGYSRG